MYTFQSRWHRSRSKERVLGGGRDGSAGSSTEYAADQSSDHSSSNATPAHSPRHKASVQGNTYSYYDKLKTTGGFPQTLRLNGGPPNGAQTLTTGL